MKKSISFLLALVLLLSVMTVNVFAEYIQIKEGGDATVIEVIDGDAIKVQIFGSSRVALVKLIGINAVGNNASFDYINRTLMGKIVNLSFDTGVPKYIDRWNMMYVTCDNILINKKLIDLGYAKADSTYNASENNNFAANEAASQDKKLGMWYVDTKYNYNSYGYYSTTYGGNGININTASSSQIRDFLEGVDSSVAGNIVSYRSNNPFNNVEELKFVYGFTKEMFDKNKTKVTVSTNINNAAERELTSLLGLTQGEVNNIMSYRSRQSFASIEELYSRNIISSAKYDRNKPFIDISDKNSITFAIPDIVVNVNTATQAQLTSIGISSTNAGEIINYRGKNYSYKTIGELKNVPGVYFSQAVLDRFEDNLYAGTSSTDSYYPIYTNINTATRQQLINTGFTESEAAALLDRRRNMLHSGQIPIDVSAHDSEISLYTNINKASYEELLTLDLNMTSALANDIVNYRSDQPFGDPEELRDFLEDKSSYNVYSAIRDFVVFR